MFLLPSSTLDRVACWHWSVHGTGGVGRRTGVLHLDLVLLLLTHLFRQDRRQLLESYLHVTIGTHDLLILRVAYQAYQASTTFCGSCSGVGVSFSRPL